MHGQGSFKISHMFRYSNLSVMCTLLYPLIKRPLLGPCWITITETCLLLLPSTYFSQPVLHSCLTTWWGSSVCWQDERNCVHEIFHWNNSTLSAILKCCSTNHCLHGWFQIKSHLENNLILSRPPSSSSSSSNTHCTHDKSFIMTSRPSGSIYTVRQLYIESEVIE